MAKYRITSIPQSLPQARKGGSLKYKKAKSGKLKNFFFGNEGDYDNIAMDMFNTDMMNGSPRTAAGNQPMVEVEGAPQPSYWNMQQGCPPGKFSYNGQCFTEAEYVEYSKREMEEYERSMNQKKAASQQRFEGIVQENQQRAQEQSTRLNQEETERYYTNFKNSKKSDKIDPYMSIPNLNMDRMVDMVDPEGNPVLGEDGKPQQETLGDQLKKSFLINVTENGYTQLYPKDIVHDRIVKHGFQADQFKNIWGLDPKQVKEQLGDIMKLADEQYTNTVLNKVAKTAIEEGKSPEEVIKSLPTSWGGSELTKYIKPSQEEVDKIYSEFVKQSLEGLQKQIGVKEEDGMLRYDRSKKADKPKLDFDFESDIYLNAYDDDGTLTAQEVDPVKAYAQKWIASGKTAKERYERQMQVDAINRKDYSKTYDEAVKNDKTFKETFNIDDINLNASGEDINNMPPSDRMQTLKLNETRRLNEINQSNSERAEENIGDNAVQTKRTEDLIKLTGFTDDFNKFMQERQRLTMYGVYKNALTDSGISYADKAKVLQHLNDNKGDLAYNYLFDRSRDASDPLSQNNYNSELGSLMGGEGYGNLLTQPKIQQGKAPGADIGVGAKTWDVLTNWGDAAYHGLNAFIGNKDFSDNMWSIPGKSLNEVKADEERLGIDLRGNDQFNASLVPELLNKLNPLHAVDEIYRGYKRNGLKGASSKASKAAWDATETAAMFIPGGQGIKLLRQASLLNNTLNKGSLLNKISKGFNGLQRGINSLGLPGQYVTNYFNKSLPAFAFDAVRPYGEFHEGFENLTEGKTTEGLKNLGWGTLGITPYISKIPRIEYQTPSGRTFGIGNTGTTWTTAQNEKQFADLMKSSTLDDLKKVYSEENQIAEAEQALNNGTAFPNYTFTHPLKRQAQLSDDFQNMTNQEFAFKNLGFAPKPGGPFQLGTFNSPLKYSGKLGQLQFGTGKFFPAKLQGIEYRPNIQYDTAPMTIGFRNGGSIPKANVGMIVSGLQSLGNPTKMKTGGALPPPNLGKIVKVANSLAIPTKQMVKSLPSMGNQPGLEWLQRWYSSPELATRISNTIDPSSAFDLKKHSVSLEKLMAAQPKTYSQLAAKNGLLQTIPYYIGTGGLYSGGNLYINRLLSKANQESFTAHEGTHLYDDPRHAVTQPTVTQEWIGPDGQRRVQFDENSLVQDDYHLDANGRPTFFNQKETEMLLKPFGLSKPPLYPNKMDLFGNDYFRRYYTHPDEIHARMNQGRFMLNKSPEDPFTLDDFNKVQTLEDWFGMGKHITDKNAFLDLMNKFYGVVPAAIVGSQLLDEDTEQRKKGGSTPKAKANPPRVLGRTVQSISSMLKPTSQFRTTMNALENFGSTLPTNMSLLNSVAKPFQGINNPVMDLNVQGLLKSPTDLGGTGIIGYGDDIHKGDPWYQIDPADYGGSETWRQEGRTDAEGSIERYLGNLKPYGPDAFNNIGNFDFEIGSDGWKARNAMMGMASPLYQPQKTLGTGDFYTFDEFSNLVQKQTQYLNDRAAFDEMYPEDPGMRMWNALRGDTQRDEMFANLFPNSGIQNFKQKFYTPELLDLMKKTDRDEKGRNLYDQLVSNTNMGDNKMLNMRSLNSVTKGEDTLPSTYKDLVEYLKPDSYLYTAPAKEVVGEMRGSLGLKLEDINNATPEQLEKWKQEIIKKMYEQAKERWDKDSTIPLSGYDAYEKFFSRSGSKNKLGGAIPKARLGLSVIGKNVNNIENILNGTAKSTNLLRLVDRAITPVGYGIVGKMLASPFTYIKPYVPQTYGLKNRYDAWNLYNQIQPKYGGLSLNEDGTVAVKNFDISKPILDQIRNSERNSFETEEFNKMNGHLAINFGGVHGNGLVAKGVDDTGRQYMDFTDTWDLHPLQRFGNLLPKPIRNIEVGQVTGGKPFDLRNRIYFDGEGNYFNQDGTPLITYSKEVPGFDYTNGALQVQQNASTRNIKEIELPDNKNVEFVASSGVPENEFQQVNEEFNDAYHQSNLNKLATIGIGLGIGGINSFIDYQNNKPMLMIDVRTGKVVTVTKAEMEANPGRYISTKNLKRGGAISKKKTGGVVTELTKKEIEQYVKDGYIIEDY